MCKNSKRLLAVMVLSVFSLAGFATCENMVPTPKATLTVGHSPTYLFSTYYESGRFYHDCGNGKCYEVMPKTVGEVSTYHYYYGR